MMPCYSWTSLVGADAGLVSDIVLNADPLVVLQLKYESVVKQTLEKAEASQK